MINFDYVGSAMLPDKTLKRECVKAFRDDAAAGAFMSQLVAKLNEMGIPRGAIRRAENLYRNRNHPATFAVTVLVGNDSNGEKFRRIRFTHTFGVVGDECATRPGPNLGMSQVVPQTDRGGRVKPHSTLD